MLEMYHVWLLLKFFSVLDDVFVWSLFGDSKYGDWDCFVYFESVVF